MKEMTWKEAFSGSKSLKQLRIENNITIPEEYNNSVRKLSVAFGVYNLVLGILFTYFILKVI